MMRLPREFFYDEIRDGFYIPGLIKRAWGAQLSVLSEIDRICQKNNITYHVYAGTLLGAVRDGQCIPWDDDLDICMLRDDFFKFAEVVKKELPEELTFNSISTNQNNPALVAAVGTASMAVGSEKNIMNFFIRYRLIYLFWTTWQRIRRMRNTGKTYYACFIP